MRGEHIIHWFSPETEADLLKAFEPDAAGDSEGRPISIGNAAVTPGFVDGQPAYIFESDSQRGLFVFGEA